VRGPLRRRHILVGGDGDQRAIEFPGQIFDEARLAAAGRALQEDRQAALVGGGEEGELVADREVEGLGAHEEG